MDAFTNRYQVLKTPLDASGYDFSGETPPPRCRVVTWKLEIPAWKRFLHMRFDHNHVWFWYIGDPELKEEVEILGIATGIPLPAEDFDLEYLGSHTIPNRVTPDCLWHFFRKRKWNEMPG